MDNTKVGGWRTLPFIIGSIVGLSLASGSWNANLTMFIMRQYNIEQSSAVKIYEIMNIIGLNLFPIIGAFVSDSIFGSFLVINVASFASLLGLVMLGLSTITPSLKPHPCNNNIINSSNNIICDTPSVHQYTFLLVALSLATLGFGCTRFMLSSLGAYQFDKPEHRRIFFNVYILAYEVCSAISYGVIVFIVQEQEKWAIGFGIGITANIIGIMFFLIGSRYYRHIVYQPNPFMDAVRALISIIVDKVRAASIKDTRIHNNDEQFSKSNSTIRSLNQASLRQDTHDSTLNTKPWTHQTLTSTLKQAEDLKRVIKILPVWSAGIILTTVVTTISNLVVSQASSMDLTITRHIKLPAASMTVFSLIATCVTLSLFDIYLFPLWRTITGRPLKPLQRGGVGHVFVVFGIMALAMVEMARLNSIKTYNLNGGPIISAFWLIIPTTLLGIGAAYYFPGSLTFHYQEFPKSLKCSSTAMPSIEVVIGYYLSKAFIKLVKQHSSWVPDDINQGRLDLVYWILALVVAVNFGYNVLCSTLYKYNAQDNIDGESTTSTNVDKL